MLFFNRQGKRIKSKRNSYKDAVSLFEIIVVIIVIGIIGSVMVPIGATAIKRGKIIATEEKLDMLNEAVLLYYDSNFTLPANLAALEPDYVRESKYADDYSYDAWRKAIVYTKIDAQTGTLLSYGPNRSSGGSDDITYNITAMETYRKYKKATQDELVEVNKAAEDYVRGGNLLSTAITSAASAFSPYLSDGECQYDPWGIRADPGGTRAVGEAYRYDAVNKTFYSYGPDGADGGGDDIYPLGMP